jgi:hypothetical protein
MEVLMKTIEVFGVSNILIGSYIERHEVDGRFIEGLKRNKHIIIFGASKQGKTALTEKHLREHDFVKVNCSPQTRSIDIYKSVLRQINVEFEEEKAEKSTFEGSGTGSIKVKVKIPIVGEIEPKIELGGKLNKENVIKTKSIEYNLSLPQDITEILRSLNFNKRIILENFHYLEEKIQQELSYHLRVFEDANILFIILGIWRERNRLAQYNGDLQDRLIEVPVEPWNRGDLVRIAEKGSSLLRVNLNDILEKIISNAFDSVGVFQELCKESCLAANILEEATEFIVVNNNHFEQAVKAKLADYSGRHIRSIETFVEQKTKTSDEVPLYLGYYFIKVLFNTNFEEIEKGIKRKYLHDKIREIHHRPGDVRGSDISYFLHNIIAAQIRKNIIPPLFDYDRSSRDVKVIDSTLYFFLRNVDRDEILTDLKPPVELNQ